MDNKKAASAIWYCQDSRKVLQIGKTIRTTPAWQDCKESVMLEVLRAKARYCSEYRAKLHNLPQNTPIRERTEHRFWGGKANGANVLGRLHEAIKQEIHAEDHAAAKETQPHQHSDQHKRTQNLKTTPRGPSTSSRQPANLHHRQQSHQQHMKRITIIGDSNTKYLQPEKMDKRFNIKMNNSIGHFICNIQDLVYAFLVAASF